VASPQKDGKDGKDQAAERLASLCGFVRALTAAFKRGQSSPSGIGNNRRILREKLGVGKKATQQATHSPIRMIPQEVARGPRAVFGKGPRQATYLPDTR